MVVVQEVVLIVIKEYVKDVILVINWRKLNKFYKIMLILKIKKQNYHRNQNLVQIYLFPINIIELKLALLKTIKK